MNLALYMVRQRETHAVGEELDLYSMSAAKMYTIVDSLTLYLLLYSLPAQYIYTCTQDLNITNVNTWLQLKGSVVSGESVHRYFAISATLGCFVPFKNCTVSATLALTYSLCFAV